MTNQAAFGLGLALLLAAPSAAAFCRTNTCDPDDPTQGCTTDANGCLQGGLPLRWGGMCVTFDIQEDASPLRDVTFDDASRVISDAYVTWMRADCGGGQTPKLRVIDLGPVECDRVEFNEVKKQNANIWIFRDQRWPYRDTGHTLALTTVTFNIETGEIFDADVEINTAQNDISLDATRAEADLPSIITHEAGHFLGLSHSNVRGSTMSASYAIGDTSLRTLHPDDVAGICDIYPPDSEEDFCTERPVHGFSSRCAIDQTGGGGGCEAAPSGDTRAPFVLALVAFAAAVGRLRRKRRR